MKHLDSVDFIILDSPHYFNSYELQIDKYYSTEQLQYFDRILLRNRELSPLADIENGEQLEQFLHSRRFLSMHIRLLNDSIFSLKISNEIRLETIQQEFLSTINRRKELIDKIKQLHEQYQPWH